MPDITEATPRESYTIAGKAFNIFQPYAEGHVLTANEAASLNQTFAENVRNNFASKVKELEAAGTFDQDVVQGQLDDYMNEYEFGVRRGGGGGRTSDPVEAEAMNIARNKVREALKKQGKNLSDYTAAAITEAAKGVLAKYPQIRETAKAIVEQAASLDIDLGGDEPTADAEEKKAKKQKAAAE